MPCPTAVDRLWRASGRSGPAAKHAAPCLAMAMACVPPLVSALTAPTAGRVCRADVHPLQAGGTVLVPNLLQRHGVRERLAQALARELGLEGTRTCDIKKAERAALVGEGAPAAQACRTPWRGPGTGAFAAVAGRGLGGRVCWARGGGLCLAKRSLARRSVGRGGGVGGSRCVPGGAGTRSHGGAGMASSTIAC